MLPGPRMQRSRAIYPSHRGMANQLVLTPQQAVTQVFALYELHGGDYYIGEPASQLAHRWQAVALAEAAGADDEAVLAAFFHDLGHLCAPAHAVDSMDGFGAVDYEKLGADYLRARGFSARVAMLVENHVQAKRSTSPTGTPATCASFPRPAWPRWPFRAG